MAKAVLRETVQDEALKPWVCSNRAVLASYGKTSWSGPIKAAVVGEVSALGSHPILVVD